MIFFFLQICSKSRFTFFSLRESEIMNCVKVIHIFDREQKPEILSANIYLFQVNKKTLVNIFHTFC